jgi:hypothetical protein
MMTETQIARLAAAISHLRPDWPQTSLHTFISRELRAYAWRDAAVMLTWVATDEATQTPARVLEAGPWRKAAQPGGVPRAPQPPKEGTCGTCYLAHDDCRNRWSTDHEFEPLHQISRRRMPAEEADIRSRT